MLWGNMRRKSRVGPELACERLPMLCSSSLRHSPLIQDSTGRRQSVHYSKSTRRLQAILDSEKSLYLWDIFWLCVRICINFFSILRAILLVWMYKLVMSWTLKWKVSGITTLLRSRYDFVVTLILSTQECNNLTNYYSLSRWSLQPLISVSSCCKSMKWFQQERVRSSRDSKGSISVIQ